MPPDSFRVAVRAVDYAPVVGGVKLACAQRAEERLLRTVYLALVEEIDRLIAGKGMQCLIDPLELRRDGLHHFVARRRFRVVEEIRRRGLRRSRRDRLDKLSHATLEGGV